jgi:hypothetical protein
VIPSSLISEPVTLVQRVDQGDSDDYGDVVLADNPIDTHAFVEPFRAMEDTANTNQQANTVRMFLAADVDPTGYDAVRREDGSLYEIQGTPGAVRRAWPPRLDHYELLARQVV